MRVASTRSLARRRSNRLTHTLLTTAIALAVTQCSSESSGPPPPDTTPAAIGTVSGDSQKGLIGTTLPDPLRVRVTNSAGSGITGVTVNYTVASGSATLSATSATTSAGGNAEVTVTLGNAGEVNTIQASVSGVSTPAEFTVTALAPTTIEVSANDSLKAAAGSTLSAAFEALVRDQETNGLGGVDVLWAISDSAGPGPTLDTNSSVTNASGVAAATLTLGNTGGIYTVSATFTGASTPATFTAIALVADSIEIAAGDGQAGPITGALPNPLQVLVRDQLRNPFPGVTVDWAITAEAGPGSMLGSATSVTDASGVASNTLTFGPTDGAYQVTASFVGLSKPAAVFNLTALLAPLISSVSPNPAREGFPATITGSNFDAIAGNNTVTVDGVTATVTAATTTSLDITVPVTGCRPARDAGQFVVAVAGVPGAAFSHPTIPGDSSVSLLAATGASDIRTAATAVECVQFPAQAGASSFLAVSAVASSTSGVNASERITRTTGSSTVFGVGGFNMIPSTTVTAPARPPSNQAHEALRARAELESQLRAYERELEKRHGASLRATVGARAMRQNLGAFNAAIPLPAVGDTVDVKVLTSLTGDLCNTFTTIRAVARSVGTFGVALEDIAVPAGGFTTADYNAIVAEFDTDIYPTDTLYFGSPSDLDTNGVTFLVYTPEVNKLTPPGSGAFTGGYFFNGDMFSTAICAQSNFGEFFYSLVPDPAGTFGNVFSTPFVREISRGTAAHEFQHLINSAQSLFVTGRGPEDIWLSEALAHLAEEVVGHAVTGLTPGSNLTFATAATVMADFDAYYDQNFRRLGFYLVAPEAQSPIDADADLATRGATWSFLRWILDQEATPATETTITRSLVITTLTGIANLEAAVGKSFADLLPEWLLALYADDFVAGVDPRQLIKSWDMRDIYLNFPGGGTYPLTTTALGYASGTTDFTVRSGSGRYFVVSSAGASPAMSFRLTNQSDTPLVSSLVPRMLLLRP